MQKKIVEDFKLNFPVLADQAVKYAIKQKYNELVVTLKNGSKILFNGYDCSFRNLPDINDMSERDVKNEFGRRLKRIMKYKHITQEQLAELADIKQSNISLYINGRLNPTYFTVYKIARALDCSMDEFGYFEEE